MRPDRLGWCSVCCSWTGTCNAQTTLIKCGWWSERQCAWHRALAFISTTLRLLLRCPLRSDTCASACGIAACTWTGMCEVVRILCVSSVLVANALSKIGSWVLGRSSTIALTIPPSSHDPATSVYFVKTLELYEICNHIVLLQVPSQHTEFMDSLGLPLLYEPYDQINAIS